MKKKSKEGVIGGAISLSSFSVRRYLNQYLACSGL